MFMTCSSCKSENLAELGAEMNIHLPSPGGLEKAGVWVFPKLIVCFDCGTAVFAIAEPELRLLKGVVEA